MHNRLLDVRETNLLQPSSKARLLKIKVKLPYIYKKKKKNITLDIFYRPLTPYSRVLIFSLANKYTFRYFERKLLFGRVARRKEPNFAIFKTRLPKNGARSSIRPPEEKCLFQHLLPTLSPSWLRNKIPFRVLHCRLIFERRVSNFHAS